MNYFLLAVMGMWMWMCLLSPSGYAESPDAAAGFPAQAAVPQAVAQQPQTSEQAIGVAETLKTAQAKKDYLIQQAQMFYQSKQFQYCMDVAQHILAKIDTNSGEAKSLLSQAKEQLVSTAGGKVAEVKNSLLNSLGGQGKK
ncbi:MAG: hypothetical protein NC924_02820 [Candidatus Omnitrophica bacterium]|nr:hypothetical protein [Candidatus Omnitrophota bacterium]